jgi:prolipoprotein diacylglyceryl transferase
LRFAIPTPTTSAIEIGPLTIHFYALCIILGIALAIWLGNKRFISKFPHAENVVGDVAIYAIPAGVIGGRLYHVITTPEQYFSSLSSLLEIPKIWKGGLGIWGAISLGALAAYISYKKIGKKQELPGFSHFADALAPGLLLAQAVGRFGNWFNAELFGRPLDAPWALEIPEYARPASFLNYSTFHPTFLYESLWCLAAASLLLILGSRYHPGAIFSLYILIYSAGRFFIEGIRIDQAHQFGGLRLNQYLAALLFLGAGALFIKISRSKR